MNANSSRLRLAAAGVLTGLAGIATSIAAAWLLHTINPVVAVASAVRDAVPGPLAIKLIHLVQHADKPLLVVGTTLALLVLSAYAGTLTRRSDVLAALVFVALAVLGVFAQLRRPGGGSAGVLTVVVGLITWLVVLPLLTSPVAHPANGSRRAFLARSGAVVLGGAVVLAAGRAAGSGRRAVEQARRRLRLPVSKGKAPASADLGVPGISPWRTPNSQFYQIDTTISAPSIEPNSWRLRVHGMVDKEITLTYHDLVSRQLIADWVTICCVSNPVGGPLIGNAHWSGVPIRTVLAEAGVQAGADAVLQTSHDGWTAGTPLAALTDSKRNAMLAIAMNGQPLPVNHGFPVRMIVPGLYGYVSATKWLVDLEVTRFDRFQAYWTREGWSEKGPVKTESRIDVPGDGAGVKAGSLRVGGSAWAQHTGIDHVEYQLDGQAWRRATLGAVPGVDSWVQWTATVQVKRGNHTLAVRATDRSGYTQTAVRAGVLPNGATGWHTVGFAAS